MLVPRPFSQGPTTPFRAEEAIPFALYRQRMQAAATTPIDAEAAFTKAYAAPPHPNQHTARWVGLFFILVVCLWLPFVVGGIVVFANMQSGLNEMRSTIAPFALRAANSTLHILENTETLSHSATTVAHDTLPAVDSAIAAAVAASERMERFAQHPTLQLSLGDAATP